MHLYISVVIIILIEVFEFILVIFHFSTIKGINVLESKTLVK